MASSDKIIYIYSLTCPIFNEIRYIGKTIQNPKNRYASHISVAKNKTKKDYAHCWIKSLLNKNLKPILNIIEECNDIKRETFWIEYYRNISLKLTNFTNGGEEGNLGKRWKVKDSSKMGKENKRKVILILDNNKKKNFLSIKDCAEYFNTLPSNIYKVLKEKRTYKGHIIYYKDKSKKSEITIKIPLNSKIISILDQEVKEFSNAKEASKELNIDYSSIMKCLRGDIIKVKNYKFKYI